MMIIRPIQQTDFDALKCVAVESGVGFTSLPDNDELLLGKIKRSVESFAKEDVQKPGTELYLFVMEDTDTKEVVGTSGIEAAVGLDDAFYSYHHGKVVHSSRELNVHNTVETLTLCNDYTGVSEICTLFLREQARGGYNGRVLSRFRFLFIAEHNHLFSEKIFAEMRGVSDENGSSPFWEWLEEHFFSLDFPTADYLTGVGQKEFIAELMPKYPIYVKLLSKAAQAVIGEVHEKTRPALKLLQAEGFTKSAYVDIFDAGPSVEAKIENIRTVRNSRRMPVVISQSNESENISYFAINTKLSDFRGIMLHVEIDEENQTVGISQAAADALSVSEGDFIRFAPIIC
ncbi:arginine N-succinyltransferase [Alteromonas sp. a30]|uniref:arginine N-succinyltransferase n=1 Tax=Alteromonas sp. a30 TaxID=2730917 RepID=UPI00227EF1C4|nr:arginine N-succinyltransferase [Alteromonas sp. a30]MCY7295315.1 arginine N-succinyltransferase [Alteromonas sp. a30]